MKRRKILLIFLVPMILIIPKVVYEDYTVPHSNSVMPLKKAYGFINTNTDSTNTTFNLTSLGSRESIIVGVDTSKLATPFIFFGLLIFSVKDYEKINTPLTGMTYQIDKVRVRYNESSTQELPVPTQIIYLTTGIENVYLCEYGFSGNFTLTYFINITPIGINGPFHFNGKEVTEKVNIDVKVIN
jgi:hypothetical protein